jgi:mevalonate pyrophosphate decarboxylase
MDFETSDYHREWIQRIDKTLAELKKVRREHEIKLVAALAREEETCGTR